MEMKPEYNYGTYTRYRIEIPSEIVHHQNRHAAVQLLNDVIYKKYFASSNARLSVEAFEKQIQQGYQFSWSSEDSAFVDHLIAQFEATGVPLDITSKVYQFVLPPQVFYQREYDEFHRSMQGRLSETEIIESCQDMALRMVKSYSEAVIPFGEYSLAHHAKANNIPEAYRYIELSSFSEYEVTRIWWEPEPHLVFKEGAGELHRPVKERTWQPLEASWTRVQNFMHRNFWTAESWYSGWGVLDGVGYVFEGWRDGEYKVLDDQSPAVAEPAFEASCYFYSLIE